MDKKQRKEVTVQYTVIAAITSVIFLIAAFFLSSLSDGNMTGSFGANLIRFINQPYFWIILLLVILVPFFAFFVAYRLTGQIQILQKTIAHEHERMHQISKFIQDLIQEDFSADLQLTGENDILGLSLVNLRDTLRNNKEDEIKRREEENRRNWLAEAMAHFGELLRNHVNDLERLSYQVLKDLTKYINAVQGGFYMLDDTDPANRFFTLTAFFAYDRRKFADQQIKWGDGLIGTCAFEKKTIHIKKVPESYIRVTSGLGYTKPTSILLEPMLHENEVYGVLEFATLESFTEDHIKLIERVASNIGSTLATIKNNVHTARLLEDSKAQAQLLSSQEEEMRQNMEELKATQEEAARQAEQSMALENALNRTLIKAVFNVDGILLQANKLFLEKFQYRSFPEIEGKHLSDLIDTNEKESFKKIWNDVVGKDDHFEGKIKYLTSSGKGLWTLTTLSGIRQDNETAQKVMLLAVDNSAEYQKNLKHELIAETIESIGIKMEMDIHGTILACNGNFSRLAGIAAKDNNSVTIFDLIDHIDHEGFVKRWESIIKGTDYEGQVKIKSKNGEEKWIKGVFGGLNDLDHQIDHVIFTGNDVTCEKNLETEHRNFADKLKKQEKMLRDAEREATGKIREARAEMLNQYKEILETNERNEALLESTSDAIIITRSDNRIVFFNKAAEDLWGYNRSEVLSQNVGMLFTDALIEQDDFLSRYAGPGDIKITGIGKEVNIADKRGVEKPVIFIISKAKINQENVYLACIRKKQT
ncbi:MAG: PAS domain S-box protein [Bacteroidales bacterium]|nr:PAS domain S-box protein [Bacteroidales bacterium]